ncbi:uncharacterized protein LOC127725323 isoform X2 [Mytilus californianus]|uniref:uncharacterized protein LOC127725323 isoform X2 n=1 Tax=Mytilus californianus TaxID=6549 RepID=UPI002245BF26|nr:uncharacterized protein LOC127725323 isoform X2 [Mytilus californianus]
MMAKADPNMCNDPCMANLCTRFCGKCPFICHSCHEVADATSCRPIIQCNSSDEYCFTVQTFNDHFEETFKLGCASKHTCLQYSSISHTKRVSIDAGCCNTDQCNNKPPSLLHIGNTTTQSPAGGELRNRTLCENLADDVCARIAKVIPNMCSDSCIANNICPHTCGKCYNCLSCDEIESPDKCNTTTECNDGNECFLMEVLTHDFKPAVRLGCMEKKTCQKFHTSVTDVFGKRQSFTLQGRCCIGEKCNSNLTSAINLTPTQTSSCSTTVRQCPVGFYLYDNICYHLGNTSLDKTHAKNYCRKQCSNLAEFGTFTPEHMKQFFQYASRLFHISSGEEFQAYVGIKDANQSGSRPKWVWEVSGQTIVHGMQTRFNPTHHTYCMVAIHRTYSSDHSYIAGLANVDCSKQYKPLCQIKLS